MKRKATWLVALPLILFVLLAISIAAGITVGFEGWAYNETIEHMSPLLTALVKVITHIGDASSVITSTICNLALPFFSFLHTTYQFVNYWNFSFSCSEYLATRSKNSRFILSSSAMNYQTDLYTREKPARVVNLSKIILHIEPVA